MALTFEYGGKTLQDFIHLYRNGQINLEPAFQRKSVWTPSDRRKLLESICTGRPLPSGFLYRAQDKRGRLTYDVIDCEQRLESVLLFMSEMVFRAARFELP